MSAMVPWSWALSVFFGSYVTRLEHPSSSKESCAACEGAAASNMAVTTITVPSFMASPQGQGRNCRSQSRAPPVQDASRCALTLRPFVRAGRRAAATALRFRSALNSAEQILRNASLGEDVIARLFKLFAQPLEVDVEHPTLPFPHLAGHDDRFDVGALHQRDDCARHVVHRSHVECRCVEQDDVGLLSGLERADLALEP